MLRITLRGLKETDDKLKRIERGAAAMARTQAVVGSNMPYAFGAEFGRHRRGRLARRSGGSYYLLRSLQRVQVESDRDISDGLKRVTGPGPWVLRRLAGWVRRLAKQRAPRGGSKKSPYRLRKAIRYYTRNR